MLVVEEKRGIIEDQLVRILYNMAASSAAAVVGKPDETGAPLLPSEGELTPTVVAAAIAARLRSLGRPKCRSCEQRLARLEAFEQLRPRRRADGAARTPYLLLGLPAQHLDARARRQPRDGRHRLPRHGAVDAEPPHRDHHPTWAARA